MRLNAELLRIQKEREERDSREREAEALAEMQRSSDHARLEEARKYRQQVLEAKSASLREYLMQYVMPTITKGLIEVCQARPDDPIDYLVRIHISLRSSLLMYVFVYCFLFDQDVVFLTVFPIFHWICFFRLNISSRMLLRISFLDSQYCFERKLQTFLSPLQRRCRFLLSACFPPPLLFPYQILFIHSVPVFYFLKWSKIVSYVQYISFFPGRYFSFFLLSLLYK